MRPTRTDLPAGSAVPSARGASRGSRGASARRRAMVSLAGGVVVGLVVALVAPARFAPLAGWDVAVLLFAVPVWVTIGRDNAEQTAAAAVREDPTKAATEMMLLAASVASLAAVGVVLMQAGSTSGLDKALHVGFGLVSVVCSWLLVHTIFALRYARLYYTGTDGGVNFNQDQPPRMSDFAYLAFTIGMTFQVSDTSLQTSTIRFTALRHALLSFLFGAVIIAATINLVAGLAK